ncbi:hypothetical protein M3Y97_00840900 [Aphelenchoides bicaudatus]|nr:hypothetical protein M3Y97_00840900 [Aphelenchoides bicaudatus]
MVYEKKIEKWAESVGLSKDFWTHGDAAPLKEFFSRLLSSEILRTAPDIVVAETIPFEKLLSIGQYKLGIHTCLVGSDLIGNDANLKLGLFGQTISLKSALSDFKSDVLLKIPSPDFGIAGGNYNTKAICQKCAKPILFIERIIVAERAFHRACMHCHICGKRLFLGMFRIVGDHLECFEHLLNKAISGNELISFESAKCIKSPPPRPPPPRKSIPAEEPKISPVPEKEVVEKKIEQKPIEKKIEKKVEQKPTEKPSMTSPTSTKKPGNGGSDHSESDKNWDIIEYPEQLNPFSDDEIDKLSDNMSSLNPFGTSSDESGNESDVEHVEPAAPPVPMPRKLKTPPAEEPKVIEEKREITIVKEEPMKNEPEIQPRIEITEKVTTITEVPDNVVEEKPKPVQPIDQNIALYPDLKKLFVDTESETLFNFYLPSSLALCKKRLIDMTEFDRVKLLHELDKVIKTLDYIEKQTKDCEYNLLKELKSSDDFKWEKNPLVDEWGKSMKLKHENLLKGSMIVHEYLKKLLETAIRKIDQGEGNGELRDQLVHLQTKLKCENSVIPTVMEEGVPKPKDDKKKKTLTKKIKKIF